MNALAALLRGLLRFAVVVVLVVVGIVGVFVAWWLVIFAMLALSGYFALRRFFGVKPTAGVPPRIMGFGPVPATQKLMERRGYKISDFDVIELNEAFACQALACMRGLGLPDDAEHVNPNGGAIAIGHPLGMSGARLALTAALEMNDRKAKRALATMCIGVGQGIALALESVD
jgi:hypothetical protein